MKRARFPGLLLPLWALAVLCACSAVKGPSPAPHSPEAVTGRDRIGQIIHLGSGKVLSFDQLVQELGSNDLIFIGEVHVNPEHHLMQVQLLQALWTRYGSLGVAMEFFETHDQPTLDGYMEGSLTEEEFLKGVDWSRGWGFHYHFYRPLLLLVKGKGGRILAMNAPGEVVRKVARSGIESLSPQERGTISERIDLENSGHRAYLKEVYGAHSHGGLRNFDYFYQAQCVWEETMAQNIAKFLEGNRKKTVVFAGNGHIIYKFGIPERTLRRTEVSMVTLLLSPWSSERSLKAGAADYVWLTGDCSRGHGRDEVSLRGRKVW